MNTTSPNSGPAAFTVNDFCAWAGICRATLYKEMSAGKIVHRKLGRRTLILRTDAEKWLAALPVGGSHAA
ncbi:helix-turn-helix domain-containing protein [Candidatus Phyllobacterium onerii]|uniref:helix-turn-helix domain-containing protein n=1 Tax=Candidatus Phyllobacterium onerii TaxID=3020828 RepID=UPI00232B06CE|nr:helix-turn-helix domain-containing protein [Phyllobacterium sp. IY22]